MPPTRRASRLLDLVRATSRVVLGAVLCFAAAYKVVEFPAFETVLHRIDVVRQLPEILQASVGGAVLGLEAVLGAALLLGVRRKLVGWSAFALLVLLTGVFAVSRGSIQDTCGCMWRLGGIIPDSGEWLYARNVVLASLAILAATGGPRAR